MSLDVLLHPIKTVQVYVTHCAGIRLKQQHVPGIMSSRRVNTISKYDYELIKIAILSSIILIWELLVITPSYHRDIYLYLDGLTHTQALVLTVQPEQVFDLVTVESQSLFSLFSSHCRQARRNEFSIGAASRG